MSCPNCERLRDVGINLAKELRLWLEDSGQSIKAWTHSTSVLINSEKALALPSEEKEKLSKCCNAKIEPRHSFFGEPYTRCSKCWVYVNPPKPSESGGKCEHDFDVFSWIDKSPKEWRSLSKENYPTCPFCAPVKKEPEEIAEEIIECKTCGGQGWTADHGQHDGDKCLDCPIQVQCPYCYSGTIEGNKELLLERIAEAIRTERIYGKNTSEGL